MVGDGKVQVHGNELLVGLQGAVDQMRQAELLHLYIATEVGQQELVRQSKNVSTAGVRSLGLGLWVWVWISGFGSLGLGLWVWVRTVFFRLFRW